MAEKVTMMVIRVDLGCEKCRKKIKRVLCKIPQIQSQMYDEKANTVTITVVCCRPEMVKDKICCKAGGIILDIQIVVPPSPQPVKPNKPDKPQGDGQKKKPTTEPGTPGPPPPSPKPDKTTVVVVDRPQPMPCCKECQEGHGWGPCHRRPCMPPPCYGRPVYDSWGGGCSGIYVSGCSVHVSEEYPTVACIIL